MNMNITKSSTNTKKLALSLAGILLLLWFAQPYISKWTGSTETISGSEAIKPAKNPVSVLPADNAVADPFKEHVQQNRLSNKGSGAQELGSPAAARADPFKAFLETQNKQAQTSGISPFGK